MTIKLLTTTAMCIILGAACSNATSSESASKDATGADAASPSVMDVTGYFDISAPQAASLIEKTDVTVLDIRTPAEFEAGHIPGAIMVDYKSANFREQLSKLDRETPYIVHCRSGGRSGRAMSIFKELGFENIAHMNGGYLDWSANNLPVEN